MTTASPSLAAPTPSTPPFELHLGDCVEVLLQLHRAGRRFDFVFADPPYNFGTDYGDGPQADNLPHDQYWGWYYEWICAVAAVMSRPSSLLWVVVPAKQFRRFLGEAEAWPLEPRGEIVWSERFHQYNNKATWWITGHRYLVCLSWASGVCTWNPDAVRVPSVRQQTGDRRADPRGRIPSTVWDDIPRLVGNAAERIGTPNQLPLALVERLILAHTNADDTVLDPFAGSGTTGVAALKHSRRFVGIEKRRPWLDITRSRLAKLTGDPI